MGMGEDIENIASVESIAGLPEKSSISTERGRITRHEDENLRLPSHQGLNSSGLEPVSCGIGDDDPGGRRCPILDTTRLEFHGAPRQIHPGIGHGCRIGLHEDDVTVRWHDRGREQSDTSVGIHD